MGVPDDGGCLLASGAVCSHEARSMSKTSALRQKKIALFYDGHMTGTFFQRGLGKFCVESKGGQRADAWGAAQRCVRRCALEK